MYPIKCDNACMYYRLKLYVIYSVLFLSLVILAVSHFVMFWVTRRRYKEEARDYVTRKLEFVSLSLTDLIIPEEKPQHQDDVVVHDEGSSSSSSCMTDPSRILPQLLQRIDEEQASTEQSTPRRMCSFRSSSSSSLRNNKHSVMEGLHEPVIVTVATVSAIFQEEIAAAEYAARERPLSGGSSVIDISDIVNSPKDDGVSRATRYGGGGGIGGNLGVESGRPPHRVLVAAKRTRSSPELMNTNNKPSNLEMVAGLGDAIGAALSDSETSN